jgi:hypothetical protein
MWRDTVDMKIPIHDDFKVHFLSQRGVILKNYASTAGAWLMVLRSCKATGNNLVEIDALKSDIEAFKAWAEAETKKLETLALQESMIDNVQTMLADPTMRDAVMKLIKPVEPGRGKSGA